MKHAFFYLLFFVTTCSLQSMETNKIHIQSSLKLDTTLTINDQTTVEDVKKELLNINGIPVNQQTLHVITPGRPGFSSYALPNGANVKNVMSVHKTNVFQLCS